MRGKRNPPRVPTISKECGVNGGLHHFGKKYD